MNDELGEKLAVNNIYVVRKCGKIQLFFSKTLLIVKKIKQVTFDLSDQDRFNIFVLQRALLIDTLITKLIRFTLDFRIMCAITQLTVDKVK